MGLIKWFEKTLNQLDENAVQKKKTVFQPAEKKPIETNNEKKSVPKEEDEKIEFDLEEWISLLNEGKRLEVEGFSDALWNNQHRTFSYTSFGMEFKLLSFHSIGRNYLLFINLVDEKEKVESLRIFARFGFVKQGPWEKVIPFIQEELKEKINKKKQENMEKRIAEKEEQIEHFNNKYKLSSILR